MASQSGCALLGLLLSVRERHFAALANSHSNKRHVLAALAHGPPVTGIIRQRSVFRRGEQVLSGLFDHVNDLEGSRARTWQMWRRRGFQPAIETGSRSVAGNGRSGGIDFRPLSVLGCWKPVHGIGSPAFIAGERGDPRQLLL